MFHHSQWSDTKEQCRKMFQYREGGGGGGSKGMFLWFKSVHLRNYLIRLCPKIMEGGPPPPSYTTAESVNLMFCNRCSVSASCITIFT